MAGKKKPKKESKKGGRNRSRQADAKPTIREVLAETQARLTPSESKVVQLLLADYPVAGLGTASSLARRAAVSDPTVVRLISKLGFEHFTQFQASLLEEVEARLRSPLMMIEATKAQRNGAARSYLLSVVHKLSEAADASVDKPYDRAADLIMGTKGRILLLGGRFSRHVAGMLAGYLLQFHAGVNLIAPLSSESFDDLVDLSRKDTLIVFDYRRYQSDVVEFTQQAHKLGARVVLFSDPWGSPIAEIAEIILMSSGEVNSPYDSLAPSVAQMEALVAHIVSREKDVVERRIRKIEKLRTDHTITVD